VTGGGSRSGAAGPTDEGGWSIGVSDIEEVCIAFAAGLGTAGMETNDDFLAPRSFRRAAKEEDSALVLSSIATAADCPLDTLLWFRGAASLGTFDAVGWTPCRSQPRSGGLCLPLIPLRFEAGAVPSSPPEPMYSTNRALATFRDLMVSIGRGVLAHLESLEKLVQALSCSMPAGITP
jgi:hypothetical protein